MTPLRSPRPASTPRRDRRTPPATRGMAPERGPRSIVVTQRPHSSPPPPGGRRSKNDRQRGDPPSRVARHRVSHATRRQDVRRRWHRTTLPPQSTGGGEVPRTGSSGPGRTRRRSSRVGSPAGARAGPLVLTRWCRAAGAGPLVLGRWCWASARNPERRRWSHGRGSAADAGRGVAPRPFAIRLDDPARPPNSTAELDHRTRPPGSTIGLDDRPRRLARSWLGAEGGRPRNKAAAGQDHSPQEPRQGASCRPGERDSPPPSSARLFLATSPRLSAE